ncbi:MAG: 2TM domain-containing protein [Cyanobacteria bacterium P01_D01_bin.123]
MAERYSAEQVQQILVRALNQQDAEGFSREQLEDMAAELDISPHALSEAESQQKAETASPLPSKSASRDRRSAFREELKTYAAVNTFLLILNVWINGAVTWAIYPLLGWGLGLVLFPAGVTTCWRRCGDRAELSAKR